MTDSEPRPAPGEDAPETLAEELARLVREYREGGESSIAQEAWNLIADCVVENIDAVLAALAQPAPHDGWRLVPVEPTEAMHAAANREWDGRMSARSAGVWQAMLAAAPAPPALSQPASGEGEPRTDCNLGYVRFGACPTCGASATEDCRLRAVDTVCNGTGRASAPAEGGESAADVARLVEHMNWALEYLEGYDHVGTGSSPPQKFLKDYDRRLKDIRGLIASLRTGEAGR